MKLSYDWLRRYCQASATPEQTATMLTMAGLEIKGADPVGKDFIFEAEATSNRPDWFGVIGAARELSALTGQPLVLPETDFVETGEPASAVTSVQVDAPGLCPRYTARIIRGVKVGPSPAWLSRLLESIGLRPVNNVVDITNFVLFECCQPLHAFDFARLRGGRIIVRRARPGEVLTAIDGSQLKLAPERLVIADAERPVAIAGVMGGKDTEISNATTTVLLESAQFDQASVRSTSRALAMSTDASYRFERGVDPVGVEWASRRCAHLIQKLCGGQVAPGVVDVWAAPWQPRTVTLRVSRMNRFLGMDVPPGRVIDILQNLGVPARRAGEDQIEAQPPSFRPDLEREVDLIEEVARIEGLDKVPEVTTLRVTAGRKTPAERAFETAAAVLSGAGHSEVLTVSFQDEASSRLASPWTREAPLTFNNVVRREENRLRVSLLAELLRVRRLNATRGADDVRIFEISKVYLPRPTEKLPEERAVLALLRDDDILSVKGIVEALLSALRVAARIEWRRLQDSFFDPSVSAEALLDGRRLAVIGQVSPQAAAAFDLKKRPFAAEVDFDLLTSLASFDARHAPLPAFPASERDLAVIVDEATPWAGIESAVRGQNIPVLESVAFFDIYRGKQVAAGKKSVAFRMVFRAPDRTLTGEEVDTHCKTIVSALAAQLKAELRA